MEQRDYNILIVDDDDADIFLLKKAMISTENVHKHFSVAHDGAEALQLLCSSSGTFQVKKPDLILLDLNMPRIDGKEFLRIIRNHSELKTIPIVVLSSTISEDEIKETYDLGADSFVGKSHNFSEFEEAIHKVEENLLR